MFIRKVVIIIKYRLQLKLMECYQCNFISLEFYYLTET